MVKSKKLLSLFLAVVMLVSVFTVMASAAYTVGDEVSGAVNYKYTVEKVDTIPANETTGSAAYSADNLYAVSVWVQSNNGIAYLTMPVHFNKKHFAPVVLAADGATFPIGVGFNQDEHYTNMDGDGSLYAYSLGDYMNNTGMYKSSGATVTTKALAQCIGLGNSNAGLIVTAEFISADHKNYAKWNAGLSDGTGIVYANLDVWGVSKNAYFNTISGISVDTGWNKMFTFYFETLPDVSDADVVGDEFGIYTEDCFGVDAFCDSNAGYYSSSAVKVTPALNVVSNAVVEEAKEPSPVFNNKSQIRFNAAPVGDAKADFDVRTRGYISAAELEALCGGTVTEEAITDVGFVYFAGEDFDLAAAAEVAKNGSAGAYTRYQCKYMQDAGTEYRWACLVTDPTYDGTLQSVAYITVGGETYITDAAQETSFADLYDRNINSYLGA